MRPSRLITSLLSALAGLSLLIPDVSRAAADRPFVRTASYYLLSGPALETPEALNGLAAFDVLIIPSEAQAYNRSFFAEIRRRKPGIKILAYVPTVSWNNAYWSDPIHTALKSGIQDSWWLTDGSGNRKSEWPNTNALNLNSGWVPYLAQHVSADLMGSGLWDGVFYDEVQDSIDWIGSVDTNRDGQNDPASEANARWAAGFQNLLQLTRQAVGDGAIIITNGSSNPAFAPYVNGRMFESFPTSGLGRWTSALRDYLRVQQSLTLPPVLVVNANTGNTGAQDDYRAVRFGLGTALLGNGFYSFDFGTQNHAQLWRYDEENAFLGVPKGDPTQTAPNVWTRAFSNGQVVVNAGNAPQTVTLNGEYERLHGTQDPSFNNGTISSRVTVPAQDGILLLRPLDKLLNAAFPNGAFARLFDIKGNVKRTGFFTYEEKARGGTRVQLGDVDASGAPERIVADQTFVTIIGADGRTLQHFAPYGTGFKGGLSFAVADVDGKRTPELVVAPGPGTVPQVRVYRMDGTLASSFLAFDAGFRGGVSIAAADLTGDAVAEIVAGPGRGLAPQVRAFTGAGKAVGKPFTALASAFRGGLHVAAGDVDGDGKNEIVIGAGAGGGPQVRVFAPNGTLKGQFFAGDPKGRDGTDVAVTDVDGDGKAEIIGLSTNVFTLSGF